VVELGIATGLMSLGVGGNLILAGLTSSKDPACRVRSVTASGLNFESGRDSGAGITGPDVAATGEMGLNGTGGGLSAVGLVSIGCPRMDSPEFGTPSPFGGPDICVDVRLDEPA
jgi:hypothetical protein